MSDKSSINKSGPKFPILTRDDISKLPSPKWLVDGILPMGQLAIIFGEPASCKSFLALDIALSVAGNVPWQGRGTITGPVVYVYAEGLHGAKNRLMAWEKYHQVSPVENIYFIPISPDLLSSKDVQVLVNEISEKIPNPPKLVVFDTLARGIPLADENSSKDMGIVVRNCDEIRRQLGATVILVHHSGKSGNSKKSERGSSSIRGAMDTSIRVEKNKRNITVSCAKQKDGPEFDDITFSLVEVQLESDSSCVLAENVNTPRPDSISRFVPNEQSILNCWASNTASTFNWGELRSNSGVAPGSFDRTLRHLIQKDFLTKDENDEYRLTDKAITIIQPSIDHHDSSHHQPSVLSHPLRGDRDDGDSGSQLSECFL